MINNYRVANGLNELILDKELSRLAYVRAREQEIQKGHTRPDNSRFYTVFTEYGIYYKTVGENIALSSVNDIDRMFNGWKNSEAHNDNILGGRWTHCGLSVTKLENGRFCALMLFAC